MKNLLLHEPFCLYVRAYHDPVAVQEGWSVFPEFFAVGVIGLADAVRLKYVCAPIEPVLLLEGIPMGSSLQMEQLVLNPFD